MNKIEELIQRLCPNGVEWKTMEEVFEFRNGYTPSKANPDFWTDGTIPWFRMEDIRTNGRILSDSIQHITPSAIKGAGLFEANSFILATTATIGEHALVIVDSLANQRFTNLKICKSLINQIDVKYMFHYMFIIDEWCKEHTNVSGFASVDMKGLKKLFIPIPPIEVQYEIVRILDSFTSLAAELQAELQARREQYEYYRNELLSFDEKTQYMLVGDLFDFRNGLSKSKEYFGKGKPIVNFTDVYKNRWLTKELVQGKVDVSDSELTRFGVKQNDVFFTRTSETLEDIGMVSTLIEEIPDCVFSGFVLRARPKTSLLLSKFCSYYFSTTFMRNEIARNASFTTRATTTGPKLSKLKIPVPPLAEQERIVSILDKFEALVNDLSQGLPAEIAAVQEQYEYYRNKLLTFQRVS